ncbi:hypothetical protein, partial [Sphingobacterium cellulitidis]|uniref:hypothetical protein n=2 Tax=Sphingobacterium cellulitidis TaxID=1768011 RepID=UPI003C7A5F4A
YLTRHGSGGMNGRKGRSGDRVRLGSWMCVFWRGFLVVPFQRLFNYPIIIGNTSGAGHTKFDIPALH